MNALQEFAKYRSKIEWELRTIAITRNRSRAKRQRIQPKGKIEKFERNMLALKSKWTQMIENVFLKIDDQDIYDKMAADLTKSFLDINNTCEFEGDQSDYALRCTILPVAALLMGEQEDGTRACLRQSRRVYFLKKLLYGISMGSSPLSENNCAAQESTSPEVVWIRSQTPSPHALDNVIEETQSNQHSTPSEDGSNSCYQDAKTDETGEFYQPTTISVTVLNILFEAIEKHSLNMSHYPKFSRALESRILQIVNISHVVDIVRVYLTDVVTHLGHRADKTQDSEIKPKCLNILKGPMSEFEKKLHANLEIIQRSHRSTQFKKQVDSLLYQVKLIKARLNR